MARDAGIYDAKTVMRAVGATMCSRGLAYFESGAVESLSDGENDGVPVILGEVQGTRRTPYSVTVYPEKMRFVARSGGGAFVGECTCPVAVNCKHVAATLFAAGQESARDEADAYCETPAADGWESVLDLRAPVTALAPQRATPRAALLIAPTQRPDETLSLPMRPVILGDRGRWIRRGINWRDMTYPYDTLDPGPARLLRDILSGVMPRATYFRPEPTTIDLADYPHQRIWAILAESRSAGLPLISSLDGNPVMLAADRVEPGLDIRAGDTEYDAAPAEGAPDTWVVQPELRSAGERVAATVTLLGDPAHGVAWLDHGTPGEPTLHLARLAAPLTTPARRLFARAEPITVPAADRARFIHDFLPALRRHLAVTSRDGSADLPEPEPGVLVMTARRDGPQRVTITWHWRYRWDGETIDIPLGEPGRPEVRDEAAEAALHRAVLALVGDMAPLHRRGPLGDELVPHTPLTILEALLFARTVVPELEALDAVELDIADDALTFTEAESAPVITMSAGSATDTAATTDWLDLSVMVTVDDEQVFFTDLFQALATGEDYLVLPSGTYIRLDRPEFDGLRELIDASWNMADPDAPSIQVSRFDASLWAELDAMGVLDDQAREWSANIRALATITDIPCPAPPEGFTATLRPYQQLGYTWLSLLADYQLGGVLADDMGLGKTIQALAMITRARREKPAVAPFLVVAPTSVVSNWTDEAARFAPHLNIVEITATAKRRGASLADTCAGADVVITSYALFRLEYDGYETMPWSGLLLDEAQHIKNHLAKGYRCARSLPVPLKVAITGTPMENNLMELWAMFSIVAPGLLGTPIEFAEKYRNPIERAGDTDRLAELRRRIRPLLMRRTKSEVVTDLPQKTEQVVDLELGAKHRRGYQRFLQRERRKVLGLLGDMDRHRFEIFRSLTLLRQAALDMSLVDTDDATPPSTKLDALMDLVSEASAEGHRILIFSQFTRFLGRIRDRLDAAAIDSCYLDGRTRRRGEVIRRFRTGAAPVFLISLKAGGVGLNLTEADYCILADPWWNPAAETQAVDRAHRIGQDKPVMVYRLVARDTIEEKVMALSARKAALVESVMDGGGIGSRGLTADDIRGLLH